MRSTLFRAAFVSLLTFCLAFSARAVDTPVKDDAGMFKPETVQKANELIKQINADYKKEMVVETFPAIPEDRKADWEAAKDDPQKRSAFFAKWVADRGRELKLQGVYVLICKEPSHLEVKAGAQTRQKAFTQQNQNQLRDILVQGLKANNPDETLIKAVEYFRDTLKANLGGKAEAASASQEHFGWTSGDTGATASAQPSRANAPVINTQGNNPSPTAPKHSSVLWIVIVVIGAILLVRILSGLGRRNSGGPGYGQGPGPGYGNPGYGAGYGGGGYGGGGGGGFFRGILGGMLGGAAGSYMYDRFSHRDAGQTPGQGFPSQGGYSPPADDGTSSGGDFGPTSSGGGEDFSGGGSSGGDFGSSDSSGFSSGDSGGGGGGDSGGSSGGDF